MDVDVYPPAQAPGKEPSPSYSNSLEPVRGQYRPTWERQSSSHRNISLAVIMAVVGCILAYFVLTPHSATKPILDTTGLSVGSNEGELAPDFTLADLHGKPVRLHSFRGRPVLLLFWAVDCGYCEDEWPSLKRVLAHSSLHPALVAVDVWKESTAYVAEAARSEHLPGTILVDPHAKHTPQNVFYGPYKGYVVPTAFYNDAKGVIQWEQEGEETYHDFINNFQTLREAGTR